MGQKVSPVSLRSIITKKWKSSWYAKGNRYSFYLLQDYRIRKFIEKELKDLFHGVGDIVIDRCETKVNVIIHTSIPGQVIGKKGVMLESIQKKISKNFSINSKIAIANVAKPEVNALLIAKSIAKQIEERVSYRRAMKKAMQSAILLGAKGIRINCKGRLAGSEIARMEWYRRGRVPLQTLRAYIDYAQVAAYTSYGSLGVKVWVFKDEDIKAGSDSKEQEKKKSVPEEVPSVDKKEEMFVKKVSEGDKKESSFEKNKKGRCVEKREGVKQKSSSSESKNLDNIEKKDTTDSNEIISEKEKRSVQSSSQTEEKTKVEETVNVPSAAK